jgi:hypothetical protein
MTNTHVQRERTETLIERRARLKSHGEQAWAEYQAEQRHINQNMAKLRKARLAREVKACRCGS